jgi:hypothetical protein
MIRFKKLGLSAGSLLVVKLTACLLWSVETMPRRVAKLLSTVIKHLIQWVDNQEGIGCH